MRNHISIVSDFDGANPGSPDRIIETGDTGYTIVPSSEDNDPNYKFRLDVKFVNRSSEPQPLHLTIDWQELKFNHLRNYCYLKNNDNPWTYVPLEVAGGKTHGHIKIDPGETHFCLHPKYSYEDYSAFINKIPENEVVAKKQIGISPEGRSLWLVKLSRGKGMPRRRILVVSRIHPYETAGSYCAEGIIDRFIDNDGTLSHPIFDKYDLYLIPMANPDGVYNGLCKKTGAGGIDLSKNSGEGKDVIWDLLKKTIRSIKPHVYCEIHNWMFKDLDGIYFLNRLQSWRFIKNMPSQRVFGKEWKVILRRKFFSIPAHGFKKYCKERFRSICLCLEYPWFRRSVEDMKKLGADSVEALTKL